MYPNVYDYWKIRSAKRRPEFPHKGREFPICPKLTLPCVPFKLWALIDRQITDVMSIKPYKRAILWQEYKLEMHLMGFDWEASRNFGLDER